MKILAVDSDKLSLEQLAHGLRSIYTTADILTFNNALNSIKYFSEHIGEIELIYFPLIMKPYDGFKYAELVEQNDYSGSIIFISQTDNDEIRELIRLNGGKRHLSKPVTRDKLYELAKLEQRLCLNRYDETTKNKCAGCIYHWCEKRKPGIH